MLMKKLALPLLLAPLCATSALAGDVPPELAAIFPGLTAPQVRAAPLPGFYEVRVGAQILYVTTDGRFLVQGELFDVASETNLTEQRRASARAGAVDDVSEGTMIVFAPEEFQHTITVFTDIDCGYCRRLHREINEYLALGIRVRYMFFPRSGPATESWSKAQQVWCSPDRQLAMTRSKAGEALAVPPCNPTPVQAHYDLGRDLGIRGTPAIISDTGELIPGYMPAADLQRALVRAKANGAAR
jgi:thiol:disulfide interchange protein DsbC